MLGVEDVVNRCEADVLVAAAIAGGEVAIQQFVVVGAGRLGLGCGADVEIGVRSFAASGVSVAGDVVEEGMAGGHKAIGCSDRRCEVAFNGGDHTGGGINRAHQLYEAVGTGDEVSVGINDQLRNREHVLVIELDAEHVFGLGFHLGPGGQAVIGTTEQSAGGLGLASCIELVLAVEHLGGGVRGVGLVVVDPRSDFVDGFAIGIHVGAGQRHEVGGAPLHIEGVIRLEGDVDGAFAALIEQVEAVVEELAEQHHPAVDRGGETLIRCHVGQVHRGLGEVAQGVEHIDALGAELAA